MGKCILVPNTFDMSSLRESEVASSIKLQTCNLEQSYLI